MPKIKSEAVFEILKHKELEPKLLREIVEEINNLTKEKEEKEPAVKKQWAILISDPDGTLPEQSYFGWVLQLSEGESPSLAEDKICKATYEYNASRKGRLNPSKTVGESLEFIPAKFFKEADVWVKTKTPVLMLRTNNEISREVEDAS